MSTVPPAAPPARAHPAPPLVPELPDGVEPTPVGPGWKAWMAIAALVAGGIWLHRRQRRLMEATRTSGDITPEILANMPPASPASVAPEHEPPPRPGVHPRPDLPGPVSHAEDGL